MSAFATTQQRLSVLANKETLARYGHVETHGGRGSISRDQSTDSAKVPPQSALCSTARNQSRAGLETGDFSSATRRAGKKTPACSH